MAESFVMEYVDRGPEGPVDGWPHPMPSSARVRARKAALDRDLIADVAIQPGGQISVVALTVEGNDQRPVTGEALRSFRLSKLEAALRIFLRLIPDAGPTTVSVIGAEDIARSSDTDPVFRSSPLLELLTPGQADRRAYLDDLKKAGPRSVGAVMTIRALAEYAAANPGVGLHSLVRQVLDMPKATATRWIAAASEEDPRIASIR